MSAEANDGTGSSLPAGEEIALRRRRLLWLGAVLVVGFLLPLAGEFPGRGQSGRGVVFVNFEALLGRGVPWSMRFLAAYPLAAGLLVGAAALSGPGQLRGMLMILLALLPVPVFEAIPGGERFLAAVADGLYSRLGLLLAASLGAWLGLFVGARSEWYRPGSATAGAVALTGAALYVLATALGLAEALTLPSPWGGWTWQAAVGVLSALCMACAAGLCVASVWCSAPSKCRGVAGAAFALLVAGTCCSAAVVAETLLKGADPSERLALGLFLAKSAAVGFGVLLLLAMGLTELVIGPPPR